MNFNMVGESGGCRGVRKHKAYTGCKGVVEQWSEDGGRITFGSVVSSKTLDIRIL